MRLFLYALVWLYTNLASVLGAAAFALLVLFYTALGPVACVWTGARIGLWSGLGTPGAYILMLVGVGLFGTVRLQVLDFVVRGTRCIRDHMEAMELLRDDIWRQYRTARPIPISTRR